jgi:hypothetical protein
VAVLTEQHKEAIVLQFARFKRPAEVVAFMKEDCDLELSIQQVRTYDPTHPQFEADRDKWEPIFNWRRARRTSWTSSRWSSPIRRGGSTSCGTSTTGEEGQEREARRGLLEQIAREVGGSLTNARELKVDDRRAKDLDSDDRRQLLGSIIAEELAKRREEAPQPTIN